MQNFQIDIVDQHWIDNDPNNTDDMCSHGTFLININGVEIVSKSDDAEWTTNTSTLRLLKTIDENYIEDSNPGLILHCGQIEMLSCPISISWNVIHSKDTVRVSHIKKYLTTSKEEVIEFPGLIAEIPKMEYKNEIVKVAHQVKAFYASSKRRKYFDEEERIQNIKFWVKFDSLFSQHIL
jgi:hypothetical protein